MMTGKQKELTKRHRTLQYYAKVLDGFKYTKDTIILTFKNNDFVNCKRLVCNALSGTYPRIAKLNFPIPEPICHTTLTIPTSTQFQSFNVYSYQGNPGLYGPPLTQRDVHNGSTLPSSPDGSHSAVSRAKVEWMLKGAKGGSRLGPLLHLADSFLHQQMEGWYCKHLGRHLAIKILGRKDRERVETRREIRGLTAAEAPNHDRRLLLNPR
ncbi:LOW QUALITY PROTEIN: hypothetical protein Cgig2_009777 [Carnegiea gigantea]|uniref:Uncharacterized protein n=1 Tax=Carnegiea gigantea TaxID=171969 RepID=A0A9Q1Q4B5_9CARY|nr:LOW QUALITY PROTEIN: hypothetical protein Cgig2_009777 [Carnegiea gigantea]